MDLDVTGEAEDFEGADNPGSWNRFSPLGVALIAASVPIFAALYFLAGRLLTKSPLSYLQFLTFCTVVTFTVIGMYQVFFWVQRNNHFFPTRCFATSLDDRVPFIPQWVYIYGFSYYVMIGYTAVSIASLEDGLKLLFGGILLLCAQSVFFFFVPCVVPAQWRNYPVNTLPTRILNLTQRLDNGRNCWPSMHCSVAMYVSCILAPSVGSAAYLFAVLIGASCLYVKQHQILDLPPGYLLGWGAYFAVTHL